MSPVSACRDFVISRAGVGWLAPAWRTYDAAALAACASPVWPPAPPQHLQRCSRAAAGLAAPHPEPWRSSSRESRPSRSRASSALAAVSQTEGFGGGGYCWCSRRPGQSAVLQSASSFKKQGFLARALAGGHCPERWRRPAVPQSPSEPWLLPVVNPDFQEAGLLRRLACGIRSAAAPWPVGSTFCGDEYVVGNAAGGSCDEASGAVVIVMEEPAQQMMSWLRLAPSVAARHRSIGLMREGPLARS